MIANLLTRKFNIKLFIAAAIFILVTSFIIIHNLIQIKKDQLNNLLLQEEPIIENILLERFNTAFFLIEKMGKEIAKNPDNKAHIRDVLDKYKSDVSLNKSFSWTIFSWSNKDLLLIVDGEYGIMKNPVSLATRSYVKESIEKPWIRLLGEPVYGSTSKKWMIPGGIGISDSEQKILGTLTIGFEIEGLAQVIKDSLKDKNINVDLIYNDRLPVLSINKSTISASPEDIKLTYDNGVSINKKLQNYPYNLVLTYDKYVVSSIFWEIIYSRIIEILVTILLSFSLLFLIYKNESMKRKEIINLMQREILLNHSKSEFMRQLGHELRNFVSAISGLSNVAKEDLKEIESPTDLKIKEIMDNLEHISDISNELNSFIIDLIDLNQTEDGDFKIEKSNLALDFEDLIERSIRILKNKIKNKNIVTNIYCDPDLNKINNLDQRRIKQILISIISNAVKFSHQNSKIDIVAKNINYTGISITIKDYGVGMTDLEVIEATSKIKLDDNQSNSIELKLPITKLLIEKQGGTIKIASIKNTGTTITIVF